jgi:hypothetical protein
MKPNQISLLFVAAATAVLFCQNAQARLVVADAFNYGTTGQSGQLGNTGFGGGSVPGWNASCPEITCTNGSHSLDGTSLGLVQSFGDKVWIANSNASFNGGATVTNLPQGCYEKWNANKLEFPPSANTNLYTSFLYRFDNASQVDANGSMIACMMLQAQGIQSAGGAPAQWQLWARRVGSNIQLGLSKNVFASGNTGITNWATTNLSSGQTFFVVVKEAIVAGAANDTNCLWINPPPALFGTNEDNVPLASAVCADGVETTSTTGPGRFFIVAQGPAAQFDELRLADTWAEVTPPVGQCLSAAITADPTNVTQCAEISAIFNVTAVGTGASIQWQISGPGSSVWTNIIGAIGSRYDTPNLSLATDNGNKYRAIVNVTCGGGSSATSAVATVTLNAPTITPDGTIMDDFFTALLFNYPVVPPNYSVWFTEVANNFSDFPGPGVVAVARTAKSELYLGYFVPEVQGASTNLPVHLDVTNAIKVTFPFTPTGFTSHTNNGALRFGLYDYTDGGTFVVADDVTASGSTGNGLNVRGYMLSMDFGPTFTANSPLSLYARNGLSDGSLMGTTQDYLSMGSGPRGGGYTNAPAFQAGTQYILVFQVTRTDTNTCRVTATITGGGTNWTWSALDTNGLAYHRFDAFAMRPNSLETFADSVNIPEFKVEVIPTAWEIARVGMSDVSRTGNDINLAWSPTPNTSVASFTYSVQYKTNLLETGWHTLQTNILTTTYIHTNAASTNVNLFYRVRSP